MGKMDLMKITRHRTLRLETLNKLLCVKVIKKRGF